MSIVKLDPAIVKLDPAMKAKWVAALRSGEYMQAPGKLMNNETGGYCCYGIACLITGAPKRIDDGLVYFGGDAERCWDYLPLSVMSALCPDVDVDAIDNNSSLYIPVYETDSGKLRHVAAGGNAVALDTLNDAVQCYGPDYAFSFNEIADLIEERL